MPLCSPQIPHTLAWYYSVSDHRQRLRHCAYCMPTGSANGSLPSVDLLYTVWTNRKQMFYTDCTHHQEDKLIIRSLNSWQCINSESFCDRPYISLEVKYLSETSIMSCYVMNLEQRQRERERERERESERKGG